MYKYLSCVYSQNEAMREDKWKVGKGKNGLKNKFYTQSKFCRCVHVEYQVLYAIPTTSWITNARIFEDLK